MVSPRDILFLALVVGAESGIVVRVFSTMERYSSFDFGGTKFDLFLTIESSVVDS